MRKRYPLAMLLILAATMVVTAALATSAFALPTFTQAQKGIGPCQSCHTRTATHAVSNHTSLGCSSCHTTGDTNTPPTPVACGACHGGVTAILASTNHVAQGCGTTPGCHDAPAPAPTITSFTPTSGPVGTTVTVTGTGFTGVTAVMFNGVAATTFAATNDTTITAKVPTGATTGTIAVTTPGGSVTSAGTFTVTAAPAPTITSFTPTSGPVGTTVTVTGTGFTGVTAVMFNGVAATTFAATNDTTITAKVPTGATTGTIAVTTPGGSVTSAETFTVTVVTPAKITLKLSGLTLGSIKLHRTVTGKGVVTPLSVGQKVTLLIQKRNAQGRFVKFTTKSGLVKALGNYSIPWRTSKRGVFRMHTSIAATATHTKATSPWSKNFRVK